jgi:uncharacterized protein YbjQ (UPF0145 family)
MEIIIFLIIAYITGSIIEKRHLKNVGKREEALADNPYFNDPFTAQTQENVERVELVSGGAVIAADYFKAFLAGLRNIFGGSVSSYESLTERARREAILKMREQAPNADMIVQARIQLTELGRRRVEALAYGTAIYLKKPEVSDNGVPRA